jgi:DNA-binding NarL/FixJ family response regulator
VLLADDHVLVAEGISKILEEDFTLLGIVGDGRCALESVRKLRPDVLVLDISMPSLNGVEVALRVREEGLPIKIVFLSAHTDRAYILQALRSGGAAYVLKSSAGSELVAVIRQVLKKNEFVCPFLNGQEIGSLVSSKTADRPILTSRQREVLQLIAEGQSAKEIANGLGISAKTAEFHKAGIMEKLGLRTTAELTRYAMEHHIISKEVPDAI